MSFVGGIALLGGGAGAGAGHLYAGDTGRAAWVAAGGPIARLGTSLAGGAIGLTMGSRNLFQNLGAGLYYGYIVGAVAYSAWAAYDAYQTTERLNQAASPALSPLP